VAHNSLLWLSFKLRVPISELLDLAANAEQHYRPFWKKFKNGSWRYLEPPDDRLMMVQDSIRQELLVNIPVSEIVHGCVKRRSPLTNAAVHVRSPNVASVDVKHFFPSVTNRMVYRVFREVVGVGPDLARLLTRLTTRCGHLPQGAPTSDVLANLVLSPVDHEVEKIARERDLRPSRYVDNYDFAGVRTREAIGPTVKALQRVGLAVRHKKTFNAGPHAPHIVTGLTVNSARPTVTRKAREAARIQVYELITARGRGTNTQALELSLRGRLIHIGRTNASFVERMKRQLTLAGIVL
jgi:RNA-directed DNA polymerase